MKIKQGASLSGLSIHMRHVLIAADKVWDKFGQELVVTSGTDGTHSPGSMHYYGFALDFRIRYFSDRIKFEVANELRRVLDDRYSVFLHDTHIHVQMDPEIVEEFLNGDRDLDCQ